MKLQAQKLNIGYGANAIIFPEISFSVREGEIVALLGVNGIGKSTLLRTLSGLQKSVRGNILVGEKQIAKITVQERARLISIVLTERIFIDNISVKEFITLGRMPYTGWLGKLNEADIHEVENVISVMKLQKLQHKLFNQMSDGEKQKVLIARALCQQTPVIILDEPTAFLDFRNKKEILQLLASISKELSKIVILSTHDIEASLQYCSKCWIMTESKTFVEIERTEKFREEVMAVLFAGESNSHS